MAAVSDPPRRRAVSSPGERADRPRPFKLTELATTQADASGTVRAALDPLHHVELELTIELGRTRLAPDDAASLEEDAIIPLNGLAQDPVDVYAGGRLVARGELLELGEHYGIRITELATGEEPCAG